MSISREELRRLHREAVAAAEEAYNAVVGGDSGRKMTVGKHEAKNHAHLKSVLEEADEVCPKAADTIRWLIWHGVLKAQQMASFVEDEDAQGWPKPVFRYANVEGETLDEVRANARESKLRDYGDAVIVVINEGDLIHGECIEGKRDSRDPVKIAVNLSSDDFPKPLDKSGDQK